MTTKLVKIKFYLIVVQVILATVLFASALETSSGLCCWISVRQGFLK